MIRVDEINPARTERETSNSLVRTYRNWRQYRQSYHELMRFTERELSDVGICRMEEEAR